MSKQIIKYLTVEAVQMESAAKWDVDISSEIVEIWLPGLIEKAEEERKKWAINKRAYFKDVAIHGYEPDWDSFVDDIEEFITSIIYQFLRTKLGKPAYFSEDDVFIPSEYVLKTDSRYYE